MSWTVKLRPKPESFVARNGLDNPDFNPTFAELLSELERDPKQFKKLKGKLANLRSARLRWRTVPWRLVFALDEQAQVVNVIAIDRRADIY